MQNYEKTDKMTKTDDQNTVRPWALKQYIFNTSPCFKKNLLFHSCNPMYACYFKPTIILQYEMFSFQHYFWNISLLYSASQCIPIIFMTHRSFWVVLSSHIGNLSQVQLNLHRSWPTDRCNWQRLQACMYRTKCVYNVRKQIFHIRFNTTVKPALTVISVKRSPAHNGQFLALPTFFTI